MKTKIKKIIKKAVGIAVCFVLAVSAAGCGNDEKEAAVKDAAEVYEKIVEGVEMDSSLTDIPEEMLTDFYGIDASVLKSYVVKIPQINVKANEFAVFQVDKKENAQAVKEGIKKRQSDLVKTWEMYLPAQYELVENYQLVEEGEYILFVISEDAETIVSNFKALFN